MVRYAVAGKLEELVINCIAHVTQKKDPIYHLCSAITYKIVWEMAIL